MWGASKIARARNAEIQQKWIGKITCFDRSNNRSEVEELVSAYRNNQACRVVGRFQGAFNYCFKLRFDEDGEEWILRFPIEGDTMDPVRKVLREATVMRFVGEKTTIPVPRVIASGMAEGKFLGLGPFIIMEFARGERLDECLFDEEDNLRQHIGDSTWEIIYRQMARIYLQLSAHSFDSIGGLHLDEAGRDPSWSILSRPITLKMNELERLGGVVMKGRYSPRDLLASTFVNDLLLCRSSWPFRHNDGIPELSHRRKHASPARKSEQCQRRNGSTRCVSISSCVKGNGGPFHK